MPLIVITGASSGIGQALALHYARAGWQLALMARNAPAMQAWLVDAGIAPSQYRLYAVDVTDAQRLSAATEHILNQQGTPDVVIANAGISIGMDTAVAADIDVMQRTYLTNNIGMAATFHGFIQAMKTKGCGTLVGIASVGGIRGMPGHGAYCSSKAAVISYCESLRAELRATGVKVVTLLPGYVDTPLTRHNRYAMPFLLSPQAFAKRAARVIARQSSYAVIPWQMGLVAKLLRVLPNAWFDAIFAGRPRKLRATETPTR